MWDLSVKLNLKHLHWSGKYLALWLLHYVHQLVGNCVHVLLSAEQVMHSGFLELFTENSCLLWLKLMLWNSKAALVKPKTMKWKRLKHFVELREKTLTHYERLPSTTETTQRFTMYADIFEGTSFSHFISMNALHTQNPVRLSMQCGRHSLCKPSD